MSHESRIRKLNALWNINQLLKQSKIWKYLTIQNKTHFHNLQNSMNYWKYFYLLIYSKICLHIILLNTVQMISSFLHFKKNSQILLKNNLILILEFFNALSFAIFWNIRTESIMYTFLFHNSNSMRKLVLLPNCVNTWKS